MGTVYLGVVVILLAVSVIIVALAPSYDLNLRNVVSIAMGGTLGFVFSSAIYVHLVDSGKVSFGESGGLLLATFIGGPIVGCYVGLRFLAEKNYYARQRDYEKDQ